MLLVYAGSVEDLIGEKDYQKRLLKGGEGGWGHKAPALTLYIRNKKSKQQQTL